MKPTLLCSMPRSGSNLIRNTLQKTTGIGFNNVKVSQDQFEESIKENWFWYYTHYSWLDDLLLKLERIVGRKGELFDLLTEVVPDITFVYIDRYNKVRQAISMAKALETKEYFLTETKDEDADLVSNITDATLKEMLFNLGVESTCWQDFFYRNQVEPYCIFYEWFDTPAGLKNTINLILMFLEGTAHHPIETDLKKISGRATEKRYLDFMNYENMAGKLWE